MSVYLAAGEGGEGQREGEREREREREREDDERPAAAAGADMGQRQTAISRATMHTQLGRNEKMDDDSDGQCVLSP